MNNPSQLDSLSLWLWSVIKSKQLWNTYNLVLNLNLSPIFYIFIFTSILRQVFIWNDFSCFGYLFSYFFHTFCLFFCCYLPPHFIAIYLSVCLNCFKFSIIPTSIKQQPSHPWNKTETTKIYEPNIVFYLILWVEGQKQS